MSRFAELLYERARYVHNLPNTFRFDENGDLILIFKDEETFKLATEFRNHLRNKFREDVAKEIEEEHDKCWSFSDCTHIEDAAIARGKK